VIDRHRVQAVTTSVRRPSRIACLLVSGAWLAVAAGATAAHGQALGAGRVLDEDPARLTYSSLPSSVWDVRIDTGANTVTATHAGGQTVTVDYDGVTDDGHRVGMSPDTGCGPLEGRFFGAMTSFVYPILDPAAHHIEEVDVRAGAEELRIRMSGGSYRILDPAADDDPLVTDARFTVEDGELRATLSGLYYLLPSKDPATALKLETADGTTITRTYTMATPSGIEYVDDVRAIEVEDGAYGKYELTTDIERLQIQTNSSPSLDVFELDSDHTFKDLGQKVVTTTITFEDQTC